MNKFNMFDRLMMKSAITWFLWNWLACGVVLLVVLVATPFLVLWLSIVGEKGSIQSAFNDLQWETALMIGWTRFDIAMRGKWVTL